MTQFTKTVQSKSFTTWKALSTLSPDVHLTRREEFWRFTASLPADISEVSRPEFLHGDIPCMAIRIFPERIAIRAVRLEV